MYLKIIHFPFFKIFRLPENFDASPIYEFHYSTALSASLPEKFYKERAALSADKSDKSILVLKKLEPCTFIFM